MSDFIQHIVFDRRVASLLLTNGLPTVDLQDDAMPILFGYFTDAGLCGVVGVEIHASSALLRSLAVEEAHRGKGIAAELVAHAERYAVKRRSQLIFLLTTSATSFFQRLGYELANRESAPAEICASREFAEICPTTAAFMSKPLRHRSSADTTLIVSQWQSGS